MSKASKAAGILAVALGLAVLYLLFVAEHAFPTQSPQTLAEIPASGPESTPVATTVPSPLKPNIAALDIRKFLEVSNGAELDRRLRIAADNGYHAEVRARLERELIKGSTDFALIERLVLDSDNVEYLRWLASRHAENKARVMRASDRGNEYKAALANITDVLISKESTQLAGQLADEAALARPDDVQTIVFRARIAGIEGKRARAIEIVTEALDRHRRTPSLFSKGEEAGLHVQLAYDFFADGKLDDAVAVARHVRSNFPAAQTQVEYLLQAVNDPPARQ